MSKYEFYEVLLQFRNFVYYFAIKQDKQEFGKYL